MLDSTLHATFEDWRGRARLFLDAGIAPERTEWSGGRRSAFLAGATSMRDTNGHATVSVPRAFLDLAQVVIQHCSDERFALLYRLLWRLTHGERGLLEAPADPLVRRLDAMAKSVRHDGERMKATLRFRTIDTEIGEWDVAWYEPEHLVLESVAPFVAHARARRRWSILTPERSAHWNRGALRFAAGVPREVARSEETLERYWRARCAGWLSAGPWARIGDVAELEREWSGLPEATITRPLFGTSREQARRTSGLSTQRPLFVPAREGRRSRELDVLREDLTRCSACPLHQSATQAVFGEGPIGARIMLVGEQPGDQEDRAGRPFVGPAGQILDRALADAGITRAQVYVTNAVKHFKFTLRGKRRLHQKPELREIAACRSWLDHEIALVKPRLIVALGASAARALLGRSIPVAASRGRLFSLPSSIPVVVTIHPSYVLRIPDQEQRAGEYARLVADLKAADACVTEVEPLRAELLGSK